jgi:hypothetical protein
LLAEASPLAGEAAFWAGISSGFSPSILAGSPGLIAVFSVMFEERHFLLLS